MVWCHFIWPPWNSRVEIESVRSEEAISKYSVNQNVVLEAIWQMWDLCQTQIMTLLWLCSYKVIYSTVFPWSWSWQNRSQSSGRFRNACPLCTRCPARCHRYQRDDVGRVCAERRGLELLPGDLAVAGDTPDMQPVAPAYPPTDSTWGVVCVEIQRDRATQGGNSCTYSNNSSIQHVGALYI